MVIFLEHHLESKKFCSIFTTSYETLTYLNVSPRYSTQLLQVKVICVFKREQNFTQW